MAVGEKVTEEVQDYKSPMDDLLDEIIRIYAECNYSLKDTADQLNMSSPKVRKLLITANERDGKEYFTSDTTINIIEMYHQGKTVEEMMDVTGLGYQAVQGYLPYSKTIYNMSELTGDAMRLRLSRHRKSLCRDYSDAVIGMSKKVEEDFLWNTLSEISGKRFYEGVNNGNCKSAFTFVIKQDVLIINKMKKQPIKRQTVLNAYWKAKNTRVITTSDEQGAASLKYLYPIFAELQVCRFE